MRLSNLFARSERADKKPLVKSTAKNKISQEELTRLFAEELEHNVQTKLARDVG